MKALQIKSALLLLLFTGMVNAQIVNIPDANFKNRLVNTLCVDTNGDFTPDIDVDTNDDGEIQNSEALVVNRLFIQGSINDIIIPIPEQIVSVSGIENFINLQLLDCSINQISILDVSNLTNLVHLNCSGNSITILDVSTLSNLSTLICYDNNISSLAIDNLVNLSHLRCSNNNITELNFINLINLLSVECEKNPISNLNFSNSHLIYSVRCGADFNDLPSLNSIDFSTPNNLSFLSLFRTNISFIDLSILPSLVNFICIETPITTINFTSNSNLSNLVINSSLLTNIDITGLTNLQNLNISNNQITSFNFPTPLALNYFDCSNNNLSQIDVSNVICDNYNFSNNPNLTYINMKNGHQDGCAVLLEIGLDYICSHFLGLPNLQFICVDEGEADFWTIPGNIIMNSYCSFTPGGNYNTITGNIKLDLDNNGCDASDLAQPNIRVNLNDGTNTGASFTSNTGNYTFFTQTGSFVLKPEIENPTLFNFTPTTATIPFADINNNNTATQDFCISANGVHPDLEVVLAPIAPARPGFDATYKLVYKNKGNQTLSGSVNLVFDDAKTDFVSANPTVDNLAVNSLTWNYTSLLPFESRSIDIVLNVNSPLETPAVNIGDVLNFTATINPISGDELPDDNTFVYNQTVVGSYDPNDITCLEGNSVAPSEIGEYLHYVINFENTGNYPAENVVVKTIVDTTKFDVNSLQLLNTSNPVDARITGNVVEFIFENIQLGGPGGHGHILLKIKSKNTLVAGDAVAKNANIYFDYNAPVDTGMVTTIFQSLSNTVFEKDDSIKVSPNPTNSKININCNNNVKKIELYDVQGRILETQIGEAKTIDISEKTNGIYFLKITTEKGSKVEKVIKE